MNELALETSPYLLQHAQNPVHWKAWNPTALQAAKNQNKLMIVSIGYSACHWCHVMEHETFENPEAATVMNAHFLSIKVDREERPDVDAVYMKAVQIMSGHGGWPLNIVALPDGRPVWGGTYFRKSEWIEVLSQLQHLFEKEPAKLLDYAEKLHSAMQAISAPVPTAEKLVQAENFAFDPVLLQNLVFKWAKSFDHDFGGMARAPKFMMPNNYKFLLRYAHQTQDEALLGFVNLTLTRMAWGGIFDTVGGGFSRYSVDLKWHVPHFEKMLYDNGQLVSLYAYAFKLTQNPLYGQMVEKTLGFLVRELQNPEGGFYSALDADSLSGKQQLEEGAFYVWTRPELEILTGSDFGLFSEVFNVNDFGFWEHGNFVLIQNRPLSEIAEKHQIPLAELESKKQKWEQILFSEREKRSRPRLDDKCLTSWNAIALKGFADAYLAFQKPEYLETALQNADFIVSKLWSPQGHLYRNYKNGKRTITAYLEDYAFLTESFLALYQATFDEKWLGHAKALTDYGFDHFYDASTGFFRFTSDLGEPLISEHFETEDNVMPASNSVMAGNLLKLSVYYANPFYEKTALDMLEKIIPGIDYPSAFSNWLEVYLDLSAPAKELAITGDHFLDRAAEMNRHYLPNVLIAGAREISGLPFLEGRFEKGKTLFFVCQNKSCRLPTENFEEILQKTKPF